MDPKLGEDVASGQDGVLQQKLEEFEPGNTFNKREKSGQAYHDQITWQSIEGLG